MFMSPCSVVVSATSLGHEMAETERLIRQLLHDQAISARMISISALFSNMPMLGS